MKTTRQAEACTPTEAPAPAICFPISGCEPAKPMTKAQMEADRKRLLATIKANWENSGVRAIVALLERKGAIAQSRACVPGADSHQAGQGFALQQVVSELNALKWGE